MAAEAGAYFRNLRVWEHRRRYIVKEHSRGQSVMKIAANLGITRQRVHYLILAMQKDGSYEEVRKDIAANIARLNESAGRLGNSSKRVSRGK